jgi:predicted transcriptional regulator
MKLSKAAITAITDERRTIQAIAFELDFTEQWTRRIIDANKDNGPLTTLAALEIIRKETGLSDDQILEREEAGTQM